MRCKSLLRGLKVSSGVAEAQEWAKALVQHEARGPGDLKNAMRRLEQRYGVEYSTFWSLRYRPPREIFVSVYERLRAAYLAECERQERLLKHERAITEARGRFGSTLVRAGDLLAGENFREDGE